MATAETVDLGPAHPPKAESIEVFNKIHVDLKKALQHKRHETNKHEPQYFQAVANLSDQQLTNFSSYADEMAWFTADDLKEVRVATAAYGKHILGKVLIPDSDPMHSFPEKPSDAYFMFRAFVPGDADTATLHCIRMDEEERPDGDKVFKAIFHQNDPIVWFDI
ncbi:hypothetical protein LSUB1_G001102 [Lachnellula subtilissima]|uniref:Uncharacterized protein n=1 Tax=Lachnellula subtilissima TaxID=602034 RepID=A0A8H8RWD1_9HELO|nr:hypothetical protein LSUB1_G001102 [Lachnellula subtilissima]